jgi:hypothetical protein
VGGDFMGMLPGDDNHDDEYDDELTEFDEQFDQIESADQPRALEGPR